MLQTGRLNVTVLSPLCETLSNALSMSRNIAAVAIYVERFYKLLCNSKELMHCRLILSEFVLTF